MSSFEIRALLFGLIIPAVFAAAAMFAAGKFAKERPFVGTSAGAVALGGGYFLGYALLGLAPLVPANSEHWLPYATMLAVFSGALASQWPLLWQCLLRLAVALATAWFVVPEWEALQPVRIWWIIGLTAAVFGIWSLMDWLCDRWSGAGVPFALGAITFAGAVVLMWAGSAKFMQLTLMLAAILGASAIVMFWFSQAAPLKGMIPGFAVLLPGWMLNGWLYLSEYTSVPYWSFLLIVIAPLALWLEQIPLPEKFPFWLRKLLAAGAAIGLAGASVLIAVLHGGSEWE